MRSLRDWCGKVVGQAEGRERGFILIVVISALGVLALVAASFAQITSSHVRTAASAVQSAGAEALADAGVQLAILDLVAGQPADAPRRRFALDGTAHACEASEGGVLVISVQDEAGKVDVNAADERLLRALFTALEIPASAAAADALLDFRDADGDRRPQGAERADYQSAGRPQGPKNAPLNVVDELEQVLGFTAADVARLRPHVTVYSGQSGIAPSLASPSLISLLSRQGASTLPADASATKEPRASPRARTMPSRRASCGSCRASSPADKAGDTSRCAPRRMPGGRSSCARRLSSWAPRVRVRMCCTAGIAARCATTGRPGAPRAGRCRAADGGSSASAESPAEAACVMVGLVPTIHPSTALRSSLIAGSSGQARG